MSKNDWMRYAQMFVGMTPEQQETLLENLEPKLARQAYETNSAAESSADVNPSGNTGEPIGGEKHMVNNDLEAMLSQAQPLATRARYHYEEATAYPAHLGVPEFIFTVEPGSLYECDGDPAYRFAGIKGSTLRMTSKGVMGKVGILYRNGERLNTSHADDGGSGHLKVAYLPDEVAQALYTRLEQNRADGKAVAVQVHIWNTTEFFRPGSVYETTFNGKESYRIDVTLDGNFSFEVVERGSDNWVVTRNSELEMSKEDYKFVEKPTLARKKSAMEFIREDMLRRAAKQDVAPSAPAPSAASDDDSDDDVV